MNSILSSLPALLPLVYDWVDKQEALVLEEGLLLDRAQLADATRAGVANPEKIRVVHVVELPRPDNEEIMFLARQVGLFTAQSISISFGHGVILTEAHWKNRQTLVHECVHVAQSERLGKKPFIAEFLRECINPGYPFGRLEQEARRTAEDICRA